MPTLHPPTYEEGLWSRDPLLIRYHMERGISLAVKGTVVTEVTYPYLGSWYDFEGPPEWDYIYMGGYEYPLTPEEVTILVNAGYGSYITYP